MTSGKFVSTLSGASTPYWRARRTVAATRADAMTAFEGTQPTDEELSRLIVRAVAEGLGRTHPVTVTEVPPAVPSGPGPSAST